MKKKTRVGIITLYYKNYNFGGMLQAYALQTAVSNLGLDCEQVCCENSACRQPKYISQKKKITNAFSKGAVNGLVFIGEKIAQKALFAAIDLTLKSRRRAFEAFQEKVPHSVRVYTEKNIEECVELYDAFICGGDQIWNDWGEESTPEVMRCFTLGFVPSGKTKLSYAASMGGTEFSQDHIAALKPGLEKLDAISVREKSAVALVEKISGKTVLVVVDPVFLLTARQWDKIIVSAQQIVPHKPYAVCYFLGEERSQRRAAKVVAKKFGLNIVGFPGFLHKKDFGQMDIRDTTSGPAEFVSLIKHAELVLTDSFHGVVFSLLFHKKFYVFERGTQVSGNTMNTRLYDLLEEFQLQNRLATPETILKKQTIETIDYSFTEEILTRRREESLAYLKRILKINDKA